MLASPRLEDGVRALFDDMFEFENFGVLSKDGTIYPNFTGETAVDAREQTLRTVVDQLIVRHGDYRDLFTTRETFMSQSLAPIYKVAAQGPGWMPYEFPADSPYAGLVSQISFQALHSHPGRSSATLRGKAMREVFLCQVVPRPPANIDFSKVQNPDGNVKTARERIAFHLQNPSCAGCHRIMDPSGLPMESFDGAGAFRHQENGVDIDTSGNLDGVEFHDVVGLGKGAARQPAGAVVRGAPHFRLRHRHRQRQQQPSRARVPVGAFCRRRLSAARPAARDRAEQRVPHRARTPRAKDLPAARPEVGAASAAADQQPVCAGRAATLKTD
jgi:hypothetical protein